MEQALACGGAVEFPVLATEWLEAELLSVKAEEEAVSLDMVSPVAEAAVESGLGHNV